MLWPSMSQFSSQKLYIIILHPSPSTFFGYRVSLHSFVHNLSLLCRCKQVSSDRGGPHLQFDQWHINKVIIWSSFVNYIEFVLNVKRFWGLKFLMLVALWVAAFFIPRGPFGLGEFGRFFSDHHLSLLTDVFNQQQTKCLSFVSWTYLVMNWHN